MNSAVILGTGQWGLKASCNSAAIWHWCCLIKGCLRSPGRGLPPLIQELQLSWASPLWSLPEPHCTHASACHVPCWCGDPWLDFRPPSSLWICQAIPGQSAGPGSCSPPLLSGCFGAVPLSVRPLPCLPCCHPWFPVCLPYGAESCWCSLTLYSCIVV